jgi:hypothetical protein
VNTSVKYIRDLKYSSYDKVFDIIIEGLISKGVKHIKRDESIFFIFDSNIKSIKEWFKETSNISFRELVNISRNIARPSLDEELKAIYGILKEIYENRSTDPLKEKIDVKDSIESFKDSLKNVDRVNVEDLDLDVLDVDPNKKYVRSYNQSISKERINITKKVNNYFIAHLTNADLSMMSDFEDIKHNLDIVNKSFVTLNKPILIDGVNVILRDTLLLAPGGKKSLDAIGKMYENLEKINIPIYYKDKMDKLQKDDPILFKKYAMQDSVIALVHACFMEVFLNSIDGIGIPLTLSGLSSRYIKHF